LPFSAELENSMFAASCHFPFTKSWILSAIAASLMTLLIVNVINYT
ncbi:MAG: hypothetical protein ACI936_002357, partial [Paraglaciecola sp.]